MKITLKIPTKQFSNVDFTLEARNLEDADKKMRILWNRYFNFFDLPENKLHERDLKAEAELDSELEIQYLADESDRTYEQ